jgi:O-antigen ligase
VHVTYTLIGLGAATLLLSNARPMPVGPVLKVAAILGLVFLAVTAFSTLLSVSQERSLSTAVTLLPGALLAYLIATQYAPQQVEHLASVLVALPAIAGGYLAWIALTHRAASPEQWLATAGYQHLSVPNDLLFLVLLSPFAWVRLLARDRSRLERLAALGSVLLVGTCVVLYESRTATLLLLVALVAAASRQRPSLGLSVGAAGAVLGLSIAVDALIGFPMMHKVMAIGTVTSRVPLWLSAWHMFLSAPWLGLGPGAFSVSYDSYLAVIHAPSWVTLDARHMPWAHNLYLELLAERGLLGLTSFLALLLVAIRQAHRAIRSGAEPTLAAQASRDTLYLILAGGCVELSLLRLWLVVDLSVVLGIVFSFHEIGDHHAA